MRLPHAAVAAAALLVAAATVHAQSGGGRPGGFGRGPALPSPGMLIGIPEVQKELKLDDTQAELVKAAGESMRAKFGEAFRNAQNMSREERDKLFQTLGQESEKTISDILNDKQKSRLRQLVIQRAGLRALADAKVADELKLTPDQKSKVQAALMSEGERFREAFKDFQPGGTMTDAQREEVRKKFTDVRQATDSQLNAVLNGDQKAKFSAMQGPPFKFPEMQFGPRRPRNQ